MKMQWGVFQNLYDRLKQNNIHKHTKIRILFSTKDGRRGAKECTFKGLLTLLWDIYENTDFVAIAIFIIKDKKAQPIFKYTISNNNVETKPPENGNQIIKKWKDVSPKAKQIYMDMAVLKMQEEMDERFNI